MSKPLEARPAQEQPLTADSFLEQGKIEALVKTGRVPAVIPASIGREKRALVLIPPEGTQFGDRVRHVMGSYRFESPDGKYRGAAEIVNVHRDQIVTIRSRVTKALDEQTKLPADPE